MSNNVDTKLDLMWRAIGKATDAAIAEEIGMHPKTIGRARNGTIGEDFIANTLAALRKHRYLLVVADLDPTFDNIFEVVGPVAA